MTNKSPFAGMTERLNNVNGRWVLEILEDGRPCFRNGRRLIVTGNSEEECRIRMDRLLS